MEGQSLRGAGQARSGVGQGPSQEQQTSGRWEAAPPPHEAPGFRGTHGREEHGRAGIGGQ